MRLSNLRYHWYLISCDIIWYHWRSMINALWVIKRFKIPKTVLAILVPWHPWPSNLMPPRHMQIGPRACGKHKCGRAHKAFLAPIAIGQSLDDSSRKFMIQSCETIHVGKLSPKAVNLLDAFGVAWSFPWSLGLWHSVRSNGKDVRRKGLCFEMLTTDNLLKKRWKKNCAHQIWKDAYLDSFWWIYNRYIYVCIY